MSAPAAPLPSPPVRQRRWLPPFAVVAVIVGVVSGGHVVSDALGPVRAGAVSIGASISVTPLPGWELAGRFEDPEGVRLTRGSTTLDVATIAFGGSDVELLGSYVTEVLEPDAERFELSPEVETVTLASGLTGARIAYVGLFGDVRAPIEGEVTAVVSPSGTGVVFDGWAPAGQLEFGLDEIRTMVERAEVA